MDDLECAGFEFFSNFDSANLARVEYVPSFETDSASQSSRSPLQDVHDVEFNIWTKPDCYGTEFENANRTWFYFGIRANAPELVVKLNLVDLNRQGKMYSQGMAPVYRIIPGKLQWERVRDKPTYCVNDNIFTLSFKYKTPENVQSIVYFAFTYPYSYMELTNTLNSIDEQFVNKSVISRDDIYYAREAICFSLEGRRVELLTISSYHNISNEREVRLKDLFPEEHVLRPFRFIGKKVIFISARVHPGETPSSFVFNGILNLLLSADNPVAIVLRKLYVFKLIPMLNPDGVARGHYRTDTRGVNLNRMYLNPSLSLHPSIFAARALIRYHHFGYEKEDNFCESIDLNDNDDGSSVEDSQQGGNDHKLSKKVSHMTLEENKDVDTMPKCYCKYVSEVGKLEPEASNEITHINNGVPFLAEKDNMSEDCERIKKVTHDVGNTEYGDFNSNESGLFMYLDMHGHASKKGIFMYGNHFEDFEKNIECMLLPKIMSINNFNFHFTACNFTERNMYLKDRRDGMSREGSGRVAVLKLTGLVRSYTLECNYNTGSLVNALPSTIKESSKGVHTIPIPPKYNPHIFEEVGKALGPSILDLTSSNPITRLPNSQFHSLSGIRDWLKIHCVSELGERRCVPARFKLRNSASLHAQGKSLRGVVLKTRSSSIRDVKRIIPKAVHSTSVVPIERKENICASSHNYPAQPSCSHNILAAPRSRPKLYNAIKSKSRKESTLNLKGNMTPEKSKSSSNVKNSQSRYSTPKLKSPKLDVIKEKEQEGTSTESLSRLKLQEICFLKGTEGKRMIAKYKGKCDGKQGSDSDLIIQWDNHNKAQVFSHKVKGYGIKTLPSLGGDAGPNKSVFRVYNFSKSKKSKRPLRRLASATDVKKINKHKKRRKGQTT